MGMFDHVVIKLSELEQHKDEYFQTKDLGNDLYTYHLTDWGLFRIDPERYNELKSKPESEKYKIRVNYTGPFIFYTFDKKNHWVEYEAIFKDGDILSVKKTSEIP